MDKIPYQQWILERIKIVKLPFSIEIPTRHASSGLAPISLEEVDEIRAKVARLEKENEELHQKLLNNDIEKKELKASIGKRSKALIWSYINTSKEREKRKKISNGLESLGIELNQRKEKLQRGNKANKYCKA